MIIKIGLAVVNRRKILLVRKKGLKELILPGGKPEGAETRIRCLRRELREELGVGIVEPKYLGVFEEKAAGRKDKVRIFLYYGKIIGNPKPSGEIVALRWFGRKSKYHLSPILKNRIIPFLIGKDVI